MTYQLFGLFNANVVPEEEKQWYHLTGSWVNNGVHNLSESISLKMNIIARLDFELTYLNATVQQSNPSFCIVND